MSRDGAPTASSWLESEAKEAMEAASVAPMARQPAAMASASSPASIVAAGSVDQ